MRQDLVDHHGLRDERHNPHRAGASRARERVDALTVREPSVTTAPRQVAETLRDYAVLMQRTGRGREAARLLARADTLAPLRR